MNDWYKTAAEGGGMNVANPGAPVATGEFQTTESGLTEQPGEVVDTEEIREINLQEFRQTLESEVIPEIINREKTNLETSLRQLVTAVSNHPEVDVSDPQSAYALGLAMMVSWANGMYSQEGNIENFVTTSQPVQAVLDGVAPK
jgi:hypothetical protein